MCCIYNFQFTIISVYRSLNLIALKPNTNHNNSSFHKFIVPRYLYFYGTVFSSRRRNILLNGSFYVLIEKLIEFVLNGLIYNELFLPASHPRYGLTHWGRVTHICVGTLTIIGSDNGLSPERRLAIIWTNARILFIGPWGNKLQWNFNRNSNIFIEENTFENVVCEMLFISSRPQCVD